jgi:hypothetical protein
VLYNNPSVAIPEISPVSNPKHASHSFFSRDSHAQSSNGSTTQVWPQQRKTLSCSTINQQRNNLSMLRNTSDSADSIYESQSQTWREKILDDTKTCMSYRLMCIHMGTIGKITSAVHIELLIISRNPLLSTQNKRFTAGTVASKANYAAYRGSRET